MFNWSRLSQENSHLCARSYTSIMASGDTRSHRVSTRWARLYSVSHPDLPLNLVFLSSKLTASRMKAWGKTLDPSGSSGVSDPFHFSSPVSSHISRSGRGQANVDRFASSVIQVWRSQKPLTFPLMERQSLAVTVPRDMPW